MQDQLNLDFWRYLGILRRWAGLLALATILGGLAGYSVSRLQTPIYESSTTLLINEAPGSKSSTDYNSLLTSQRLASTYVQLLTERSVLEKIVPHPPDVITMEQMKSKIQASVIRDTQLIEVKVTDANPQSAAQFANALAAVFSDKVEQMQAARYRSSEDSLQGQMKVVDEQIQQARKDIAALGAGAATKDQRDRLQANLTLYQQSYTNLLQSYEQIRFAEAQNSSNVTQVGVAVPGPQPISPRTPVNTALAAIVGLLLALGLVFVVESLDDTLRHTSQIASESGPPVLGFIPYFGTDEVLRMPLVATLPRSPIAERFRVLRTNIQFACVDRPLRTILVTSPGPGDGKTTVATNLGVALAQSDKQVAMVDADLRRPSLHKYLNVSNAGGMCALFAQSRVSVNGNLLPTATPGLVVLTSGFVPPNPAELLGSARMHEILSEVQAQADAVVIDSPPVISVTDAVVLSTHMDGVLLVVRPGQTKLAACREAINELKRAGANVLGIIVNGARAEDIRYFTGYSRYDYSHAYEDERPLTGAQRAKISLFRVLGKVVHGSILRSSRVKLQTRSADDINIVARGRPDADT